MNFNRSILMVSFIAIATAAVSITNADIHKCTDEHGNVAYLQLPCPCEKPKAANTTDKTDATAAEPEEQEAAEEPTRDSQLPTRQAPSSRRPGEGIDACKNRYRDQIDEIDAEIRKSYTPAQGERYKRRLLALTRQLRACG